MKSIARINHIIETHGKMKHIFILIMFCVVVLKSCKSKEDNANKYEHIPFLHQLKETKNYEIIQIGESLGGTVRWDSIGKNYLVKDLNYYYKFSDNGHFIDSINKNFVPILDKNFSFYEDVNFYTMWLNDGSKIKKSYIDIFQNEEPKRRDSAKYMKEHKKLYNKSAFVKYSDFYYYYYFNGQWYRMNGWGDTFNIKKHYPEKLPPPRLKDIEIKVHPPDFVKQFYVPVKKNSINSDAIGAPENFSTGFWVMRVGLPGGDSLIYRRLGDGLGNLTNFYHIPASRGGNDSIMFISQEYNDSKGIDGSVYFSHGGLYLVRPKGK